MGKQTHHNMLGCTEWWMLRSVQLCAGGFYFHNTKIDASINSHNFFPWAREHLNGIRLPKRLFDSRISIATQTCLQAKGNIFPHKSSTEDYLLDKAKRQAKFCTAHLDSKKVFFENHQTTFIFRVIFWVANKISNYKARQQGERERQKKWIKTKPKHKNSKAIGSLLHQNCLWKCIQVWRKWFVLSL